MDKNEWLSNYPSGTDELEGSEKKLAPFREACKVERQRLQQIRLSLLKQLLESSDFAAAIRDGSTLQAYRQAESNLYAIDSIARSISVMYLRKVKLEYPFNK